MYADDPGATYWTAGNGSVTNIQMAADLKNVGWAGPFDYPTVRAVYNQRVALSPSSAIPVPYPFGTIYTPGSAATSVTCAPMVNNCSQCGAGQNTGACAGCAPTTPPGYVTTGSGPPLSTTSGLPFGFSPTSPVSIVGVKLPAWIWGAGLAAGYFALKGRGRSRLQR